jgi:transcriptional regulator with XRE-family HTH domain
MPRGRPSLEPRTAFGRRLRAAREAAGLSQAEVAARLAIRQAAYAAWERYPVALRPDQIEAVARVLKVPVKDLFEKTPRGFMKCGPAGRARRAFEALSQISRHKQADILDFIEAMLVANTRRRKNRFEPSKRNAILPAGQPADAGIKTDGQSNPA